MVHIFQNIFLIIIRTNALILDAYSQSSCLKLIQNYAHEIIKTISYTVRRYSTMFCDNPTLRTQTPLLYAISDSLRLTINTCAALLKLSSTMEIQEAGVGTFSIVGIYVCVCACVFVDHANSDVMGVTYTSAHARAHTHIHTHTHLHTSHCSFICLLISVCCVYFRPY